jgi:hypothetical protein
LEVDVLKEPSSSMKTSMSVRVFLQWPLGDGSPADRYLGELAPPGLK